VSVLSELSGFPVDVIGELYASFDTMPEQTLNDFQRSAVDAAGAAVNFA
jgi:hypothetical protein